MIALSPSALTRRLKPTALPVDRRSPVSRAVRKSTTTMPSAKSKETVKNLSVHVNSPLTQGVPSTLHDAIIVFLKHPSVIGVLTGLICFGSVRMMSPFTAIDALVAISVALFWVFQEWGLHKYGLHSTVEWFGSKIHEGHHQKPYYHVCVDEPTVVFGTMFGSAIILKLFFIGQPIGDTAIWTYWLMGLMYTWCHYLVHTRYIPQTQFMKTIRRNHMRHHCRDNRYWFSFMCPLIDEMMDTVPPRTSS